MFSPAPNGVGTVLGSFCKLFKITVKISLLVRLSILGLSIIRSTNSFKSLGASFELDTDLSLLLLALPPPIKLAKPDLINDGIKLLIFFIIYWYFNCQQEKIN